MEAARSVLLLGDSPLAVVTKALGELLDRTSLGDPVKDVLAVFGEFLHPLYG